MAKRTSKTTQRDHQEIARDILNQVVANTGESAPAVDPAPVDPLRELARQLGRRGGLKGGPKRAATLTKEQLSEIGKKGAQARWKSPKKPKK